MSTRADVVTLLEQQGLFTFVEEAVDEVDDFVAIRVRSGDLRAGDRLRKHLSLAAAEFALIPGIAAGSAGLPVAVPGDAARVAVAKFNCTLFDADGCDLASENSPSRITVFSADAARMLRVAGPEGFAVRDPGGSLAVSLDVIRSAHMDLGHPRFAALARPGGVLDLQALIWRLHVTDSAGADQAAVDAFLRLR
jgi:hypothetical protein